MRRSLAVFPVVVSTALVVWAATAHGVPTPTADDVRVHLDTGRCYPLDAPVPVRITGLAPSSSVLVSTPNTAAVVGRASSRGTARVRLVAPGDPAPGRRFSARLVEVSGSGEVTGEDITARAAFVLGTSAVCRGLNRSRPRVHASFAAATRPRD